MAMTPAVNAQVNASYNFDTTMQGWTSGGAAGSFSQSSVKACGSGAIRANVYYGYSSHVISPLVGQATGNPITMSIDYKVVKYDNFAAAPSSQVGLSAQWSNALTGPYTTFYTVTSADHISSNSCAIKTATFTPGAGPVYVKIISTSIGESTDLYFYYDKI